MQKRERGFSLLEVMLAMSVMIGLAAVGTWVQTRNLRTNQSQAQGDNLNTLNNAVATYMTNYFTPLVNGTAVTGVASPYAPQISELQTLGLLSNTFSTANNYGGGYVIAVSKVPAACTPPNCDLASLVNLSNPITDPLTGRVDTVMLGSAAARAGGNAGYSTAAGPGTINWLSGNGSVPNPQGAVAGILGMRAGYGSSGWAQFTRRDGTQKPTANWDMANYNVTGINSLGSTSLTNSSNATIGGTLGVTGQTTTNGITNNGALQNNGNLTVTGTTTTNTINNTGNIINSGDVQTGRLWLKTIVANGGACAGLNGYQAATAAGSIASCINGVWTTPNATTSPPPPCSTATLSWGSGCSGSVAGTTSGNTSSATATVGTGSATFACNSGSWLFQSGTCTPPPAPCSGTYSWGGGKCSSSYSMNSGQTQSLSYSATGPAQAGGSYSGSAQLSCTNGSISTVGTPTCSYTVTTPEVINSSVASQQTQPTGVHLAANGTSQSSWCSTVLPGSSVTSATSTDLHNSGQWTCWGNSGYTCSIPWDGSVCSGRNGCSCWSYTGGNAANSCFVTASLTCTRTGP